MSTVEDDLNLAQFQGHVAVVNSLIAKGENVDAATNVSNTCNRLRSNEVTVTYLLF